MWKGGEVVGPECGIAHPEGDYEVLEKVPNGFMLRMVLVAAPL